MNPFVSQHHTDARPGRGLGHAVERYAVLGSTNRVLAELGRTGAAHGFVVVADHQTAGSGKSDRRWESKPGASLLFSVLLRLDAPYESLPQITLVAAVAMRDALAALGISEARVKWPNDILIGGRKLCGILAETGTDAAGDTFVVLGVGLNLSQTADDFPLELREVATSLAVVSARPIPRRRIFHAVLDALETWLAIWRDRGFEPVRGAWNAASCTLGRAVAFDSAEGTSTGEAVGLAADGGLLVRDPSGAVHAFHSGEMRFLPEPAFEHTQTRSAS